MAAAAAGGLILSLIEYFSSDAIGGTAGVVLVIVTTALLLLGALALALLRPLPVWVRGILDFLLLIDLIGTGVAGWFLELPLLMAFMAFGILALLTHLVLGPRRPGRVRTVSRTEALT